MSHTIPIVLGIAATFIAVVILGWAFDLWENGKRAKAATMPPDDDGGESEGTHD